MKIQTKRAYEPVKLSDGYRVLVDRMWPRGVSKVRIKCDLWLKEIAPTAELRKWFDHDPKKWTEFKARYYAELRTKQDLVSAIVDLGQKAVTLVYAAKEKRFNNAAALKAYIDKKLKPAKKRTNQET